MKILKTIGNFSNRICPSYDQAGDLSSIVTLAVYAVSVEPIGVIAVSTMLFASIYNAMQKILESVPMAAPRPSKPVIQVPAIDALRGESLEGELSHKFEDDKEPKQDENNIFRF